MSARTKAPWWRRGLARKALTRPLWWWHKRRRWPIRQRVFRLPPHPVAESATGTRLVVQSTPAGLADAAWAAYSFLRQLDRDSGARLGLAFHLDSADPAALAGATVRWQALFPGARVRSTYEPVEHLAAVAPSIARLARMSPVGRKLAVLLEAQQQANVLYADPDVLLFRFPAELAEAIARGGPALYNFEDGELNGDERLLAHARSLGWPPPARRLNSGLLFVPRGSFDLAAVETLLASGEFDAGSWFVEQTVVALLFGAAGAQPLPEEDYVVSTRGQFYGDDPLDHETLVARHFTTPVRHVMYAKGMPLLWRWWGGR